MSSVPQFCANIALFVVGNNYLLLVRVLDTSNIEALVAKSFYEALHHEKESNQGCRIISKSKHFSDNLGQNISRMFVIDVNIILPPSPTNQCCSIVRFQQECACSHQALNSNPITTLILGEGGTRNCHQKSSNLCPRLSENEGK